MKKCIGKVCALSVLFVCFLIFVGGGIPVQNFEAAVLVRVSQNENVADIPLMLEDEGENIYTVTMPNMGTPEFVWSTSSGLKMAQYDITDIATKFVFRGGSYFIFCDYNWSDTLVKEIDTDTGEVLQNFYLGKSIYNFLHISADYIGNSYSVSSFSSNAVDRVSADGRESLSFAAGINFMEVFGEKLYVHQGNSLSAVDVNDFSESGTTNITASVAPRAMLSEDIYVGIDDSIYKIENQVAAKIDNTSVQQSFDMVGKNAAVSHDGLILWKENNTNLMVKNNNSEENQSITFPGNILSLGQSGAFYEYSNSVYYISYINLGLVALDEEDEGGNFEGYEVDSNYIETPCSQLVSEFIENTGAEVFDFEGDPVTSGVCETGYKVVDGDSEYQMVVLGDINSTGTVNTSDIKLIMEKIISLTQLEGARYQAADINGDNVITVMDLHLLIRLVH